MARLQTPELLPAGGGQGFSGAVFLGLFAMLALLSCFKYLALHSTVSGLGRILSDLYSIHNTGHWWLAFTGQARPLLLVFSAIYRLVPDQAAPFVLLILQALFLALPAFWAARRYGGLAALAYALYFPVWTNALNDFHLDHLLIPLLFCFLAAARSERFGLAAWLGLLPCLIGEYAALTTACCGVYLYAVSRRRPAGTVLMLVGLLLFFLETTWIVPFCTAGTPAWAGWTGLFAGAGQAVGGTSTTPWLTLTACFGALLFLPLFRPKVLLPALPALGLILFSGPEAAGWTAPATAGAAGALFFSFCEVLGPLRELARQSGIGSRRFGATVFSMLLLVHVFLAPSPVSRLFLTGGSFAFGMEAYEPTARDAAILAAILRSVPDADTVAVVSQNTLNWGALAERHHYASFPLGVFTPVPVRDLTETTWKDFWTFIRTGKTDSLPVRSWQAQYVLLDLTRPWCVRDRQCPVPATGGPQQPVARDFNALVLQARQEMDTVYDQGGFVILRRRPEPTPAAAKTAPPPVAPDQPAETPAGNVTP